MKKIDEMSIEKLRKIIKELNISIGLDTTEMQLVEAKGIQKAFTEVGNTRKKIYGYITITVKNSDKSKAAKYINDVCVKMQEMDKIFKAEYTVLNCPDYDDVAKSYTDMISFTKLLMRLKIKDDMLVD